MFFNLFFNCVLTVGSVCNSLGASKSKVVAVFSRLSMLLQSFHNLCFIVKLKENYTSRILIANTNTSKS